MYASIHYPLLRALQYTVLPAAGVSEGRKRRIKSQRMSQWLGLDRDRTDYLSSLLIIHWFAHNFFTCPIKKNWLMVNNGKKRSMGKPIQGLKLGSYSAGSKAELLPCWCPKSHPLSLCPTSPSSPYCFASLMFLNFFLTSTETDSDI